ncbi:MAG: response regulator [Bdellovibrionales bacterium]|nr:response regulator [Bdellovibrionales bacterium]
MKPRVLVVEDAPDQMLLIRATLNGDFELAFAATLTEARSELAAGRTDLVLLDSNLPDGNGFDFCAELSGQDRVAAAGDPPVVFLSGLKDAPDRIRAFRAGASDYLTKPFHPAELRARVAARIRRERERFSSA